MKKIGVGIIGSGSIAEIGHCPSIQALPNAELAALCDTNTDFLASMAKKWEPRKTYTDYTDLIADPDVQVVIVATPNRVHAQQAIDAMRAKKHVIVEKPFACTHDEAWAMVDVCKKEGVFLMAGTNQRFWEQNVIARQLIADGFIGQPMMGRSSLHESWGLYHEQLAFTQFRSTPSEAAAGALFDLGAHRADLLTFLMGSMPKRVVGIVKRLVTPAEYTTLDDSFWIMIEFENGATGVISGDRYSPAVSNISEVYGSDGTIFTGSEATNPFQAHRWLCLRIRTSNNVTCRISSGNTAIRSCSGRKTLCSRTATSQNAGCRSIRNADGRIRRCWRISSTVSRRMCRHR